MENRRQSPRILKTVQGNQRLVIILLIGIIAGLGAWSIYSWGYNAGLTKNTSQTTTGAVAESDNPVPISGVVSSISSSSITVKLLGSESSKATITSDTRITSRTGILKVSDIKTGNKVVMSTKSVSGSTVATSILVQP